MASTEGAEKKANVITNQLQEAPEKQVISLEQQTETTEDYSNERNRHFDKNGGK